MNIDFLKDVALAVAQEQDLETVLKLIVEGINEEPDVALVRLWILESEDNSTECRLGPEAPNQTRCLRLVASAGHPLNELEDWSRLHGAFGRVPLGVGKVGLIGQSGESILIPDISVDQRWVARPEWVQREAIRSFAGHPLKFRKEVLGVLGVFSRAELPENEFGWLRTFADSAAVAITNARRFQALRASRIPRHCMPGYDGSVPPGQNLVVQQSAAPEVSGLARRLWRRRCIFNRLPRDVDPTDTSGRNEATGLGCFDNSIEAAYRTSGEKSSVGPQGFGYSPQQDLRHAVSGIILDYLH
jgi:hypothetical protein